MNNQNNKQNKKKLAKNQHNKIKLQLKTVKAHISEGVFIYSEKLSIAEFSKKINKTVSEIIKYFFNKGLTLSQNDYLSEEQLGELCLEFGLDFKREKSITHENLIENFEINNDPTLLKKRPPIVTIMGHVDHGKTTLLDTIRNSNIVDKECGGITQNIGAYQINTKNNEKITFVDTPGHEAFTKMRALGSTITDIIVLVIAADDGIMPQTKEAIDHAKVANVPIIVFINKIDKPEVNSNKILIQLAKEKLTPEEWGGETICVKGSAKHKQGIDELLNNILLISNLMELKANPNCFVLGVVIEARLNRNSGPVATLLIQSGTLKIKDALVVGCVFGYVRNLSDENGKKITTAGPSTPVVIHGLNEIPNAGDKFMVFSDEKLAREIALKRKIINTMNKRCENKNFSLENFSSQIKHGESKQINIILKADTQGAVEAIKTSLLKINIEGIKINILRAAVGDIFESDITLGLASKSLIIGFNVKPTTHVRKKAENEKVLIRLYTIIYKLIEEIISIAKEMLTPKTVEEVLGQAIIREIFKHSEIGTIAGCHVIEGVIQRKSCIRILRNGIIIYNGELASLKCIKNDIKEAKIGVECGLTIKNYNDLKKQDIIEAYIKKNITK